MKNICESRERFDGGEGHERSEKILYDDSNGLDYVVVGDYYPPMMDLPEETRPIGYWGMLGKNI